jgi:endonuclease/exonuclease/phosphatase family metal-dependent hydrolase
MQITTWNCCRGKPEIKLPHLLKIDPDIVAIQEAAKPSGVLGKTQAWYGDNPHQGLLAVTYNDFRLEPVRRKRTIAKFFDPMRVTGAAKFNLLHIWVKPSLGPGRYMDTLLRGIAAYRDFIQSDRTIVLGDLNSAAYWGQRHLDFVEMMRREFNLVSAYHEYFDLKHGDETHFTYFDRTQHGKPYHIDYCFIPKSWLGKLNKVEVGTPTVWTRLSDHTPLTIELKL